MALPSKHQIALSITDGETITVVGIITLTPELIETPPNERIRALADVTQGLLGQEARTEIASFILGSASHFLTLHGESDVFGDDSVSEEPMSPEAMRVLEVLQANNG